MKAILILATLMVSALAQAKNLSIRCEGVDRAGYAQQLNMTYDVPSLDGGEHLQSMTLNDVGYMDSYQEVSRSPAYRDGEWQLQVRFYVILGSHVKVTLNGCNDQNPQGSGQADLDMYIGRPLPTTPMNCSCSYQ